MTTTEKWYWVINHPSLNHIPGFNPVIEVMPMDVNPETDEWDEDLTKNTKSVIAFEVAVYEKYDDVKHGPVNVWKSDEVACHYWKLDCGGDTFPEAVHALYQKVMDQYGAYLEEQVC